MLVPDGPLSSYTFAIQTLSDVPHSYYGDVRFPPHIRKSPQRPIVSRPGKIPDQNNPVVQTPEISRVMHRITRVNFLILQKLQRETILLARIIPQGNSGFAQTARNHVETKPQAHINTFWGDLTIPRIFFIGRNTLRKPGEIPLS